MKLAKPFFYPIVWAAIIAAVTHPIYKKLQAKIKHPNLSAFLMLAIVVVTVLVPLTLLLLISTKEVFSVVESISQNRDSIITTTKEMLHTVESNPLIARLHINISEETVIRHIAEAKTYFLNWSLSAVTDVSKNFLLGVVMFVIMIYTLFFFIRDGERWLRKCMWLSPFDDKYEERMFEKFTLTASSALKSTVVVGGIQGTLGGILFASVGVGEPLIGGLIMGFAAMIPGFGTALVWLPTGLGFLLMGHTWQGIVVLLVGLCVISVADNILLPMLVGKETHMHPLFVLFSILGGIVAFGFSGFVIGPIIVALFLAFWEIYEQYYREELVKK